VAGTVMVWTTSTCSVFVYRQARRSSATGKLDSIERQCDALAPEPRVRTLDRCRRQCVHETANRRRPLCARSCPWRARNSDFRFTAKSRLNSEVVAGPKRANRRHSADAAASYAIVDVLTDLLCCKTGRIVASIDRRTSTVSPASCSPAGSVNAKLW
jgi:hypothetical protein